MSGESPMKHDRYLNDWAFIEGLKGDPGRPVDLCRDCGAVVWMPAAHDEWHDRYLDQRNSDGA